MINRLALARPSPEPKIDLLDSIPSIVSEARAKIVEHNKQIKSTKKSLFTETVSNIIFVAAAYQLELPHIEEAILGAMLVYAPLAYEFGSAAKKKSTLIKTTREYLDSNDASVYDSIGLTFRGNRPLQEQNEAEPFITWSEIADPIDIRPKNNYGVVGSFFKAAISNVSDISMLAIKPAQSIGKRLKSAFQSHANDDGSAAEFAYTQDPCDNKPATVMRTHLTSINDSAVVQMPAHPDRLKKSRIYTLRSLLPDYAQIFANGVGIYGAGEFCYAVGRDILPNIQEAAETGNPWHYGIAATWAVTVLVGMGPGKHFLDDASKIHSRIKTKWLIAGLKAEGLETLEDTRKTIMRTIKDYNRHKDLEDDANMNASLQALRYHCAQIDITSLDENTQTFLSEHDIVESDNKPDLSPYGDVPEELLPGYSPGASPEA